MQNKNMKNENRFPDTENQGNSENIDINTDENLSGSTHLNEPVSDEPEIEKLKAELEEQKEINRELYYLFYLEQEKKRKEVYTITKMQEAQLRELKRSLDDIVNKISPDDEITDPSIP